MTTKLEDAKSIIQDEEIEKTLELKSQTEEVLVIKAEEPAVETVAEPVVAKSFDQIAQESTITPSPTLDPNTVFTSTVPNGTTSATTSTVGVTTITDVASPLEKSFAALSQRVSVLKSQGLSGENALKELQSEFEQVGETLKAEFTPAPTVQDVANQNMEATLRSLLSEMLPQYLAQAVAPIQSEVGELRALSLVKPIRTEQIPQPRSLNVNLVQKAAIERLVKKQQSQFDDIARASVGL